MKQTEMLLDLCLHEDAYFEKACCNSLDGPVECACGGRSEVVCPNEECQGIDDSEVVELFERFTGGGSDCE